MQADSSICIPRLRASFGELASTRIARMNWIVTLIIGGIIGWLASILMKTNAQMGWIANVLVGVVGSALGFWLAGVLGIAPADAILRYAVAVGGAVLLIVVLRALGLFR
jgi:uncharacterized membrane protein YeaQ/YmgE (transglycosylase-associated protein family)